MTPDRNMIFQTTDEEYQIFCACGCQNRITLYYHDDDFIEMVPYYTEQRGFFGRLYDAIFNKSRPWQMDDICMNRDRLIELGEFLQNLPPRPYDRENR